MYSQTSVGPKLLFAVFFIPIIVFGCDTLTSGTDREPVPKQNPTEGEGTLEVVTETIGRENPPESFTLTIDGESEPIGVNDTKQIESISAGEHSVELSGLLAKHCGVRDSSRIIYIDDDETTEIEFTADCWTPKGILFFEETSTGQQDIFLAREGEGKVRQITDFDGQEMYPRWGPDGKRVFFWSGGHVHSVLVNGEDRVDHTPDMDFVGAQFALSPNAEYIAAAMRIHNNDSTEVRTMNLDTGEIATISDENMLQGRTPGRPSFSSDGKYLAYESSNEGETFSDIKVANLTTGEVRNVTNSPNSTHGGPTFFQNGKKIMYIGRGYGSRDIWVMNSDGNGQTRLIDTPGFDIHPTLGPDEESIAFATNKDGEGLKIFTAGIDGSNIRRLTTSSEKELSPNWR